MKHIIPIASLIALMVGLLFLIVEYKKDYAERCRAVGGEPVFGQYKNVCINPGATIDLYNE